MAIQLQVPVVPVKISGLFEVLSQHDRWPKAGRCVVRIGYPLKFRSEVDPELVARLVEKAVRELGSNDSKSRC
jgi:1-acyl-sn-glycerol-3-phosphate acyltransferase